MSVCRKIVKFSSFPMGIAHTSSGYEGGLNPSRFVMSLFCEFVGSIRVLQGSLGMPVFSLSPFSLCSAAVRWAWAASSWYLAAFRCESCIKPAYNGKSAIVAGKLQVADRSPRDRTGLEGEARTSGEAEVRDSIDDATSSPGTSESFEEGALVSQTLEEVRDALHRLADGSYGKCTLCGRQIERTRLEAVPWTPYCLKDQQKQDRENHHDSTL
jgi:DnaK suppressor protein